MPTRRRSAGLRLAKTAPAPARSSIASPVRLHPTRQSRDSRSQGQGVSKLLRRHSCEYLDWIATPPDRPATDPDAVEWLSGSGVLEYQPAAAEAWGIDAQPLARHRSAGPKRAPPRPLAKIHNAVEFFRRWAAATTATTPRRSSFTAALTSSCDPAPHAPAREHTVRSAARPRWDRRQILRPRRRPRDHAPSPSPICAGEARPLQGSASSFFLYRRPSMRACNSSAGRPRDRQAGS